MIRGQRFYYQAFVERLQIFKHRLSVYNEDPGAERVKRKAAELENIIKTELEVGINHERIK